MLDIQKKQLDILLNMLDKAGAQYKIILDDGTEYGALEVQTKKEMKRRSPLLPRGTLSNHYVPYVENLQAGEVVSIPLTGFDPEAIRSSLASWAHAHWGSKGATSMVNKQTNHLEVLRLK